jgi:TfoX/Sxy family transcriptional regulator of competence genes
MPYDLALADEIRTVLDGEPGMTERRMFGGLSFLVDGNLAVAVRGSGAILVRVGADAAPELERTTAATHAVMGARVMAGWLEVGPDGLGTEADLSAWVRRGVDHARSLPPKAGAGAARARRS